MDNDQLTAFRQLTRWQSSFNAFAGILLALALFSNFKTLTLIVLGIIALIVVATYYGSVLCHELYEINDQLAGRSPELKEWLGKRGDKL